MNILIIIAILLIPMASMVTIRGTCVWYPQLLALEFIGGIIYASMFWKINKFLAIFLAYLAFSYIYIASGSPRTMMCLLIGYMAIGTTLAVSQIKDLKYVYCALIGISFLSIAYSISQGLGFDPIFVPLHGGKEDVVSFLGSHNQLGVYSVANAFWCPWLIPLAVIPTFLAKCNSAMIGLVAGGLLYAYFQFGKKTLYICTIAIAVLVIPWWNFNHKSRVEIRERFNIWNLSLHQICSGRIEESMLDGRKQLVEGSSLTGFGLGNFFTYSPMSQYKIYGLDRTRQLGDAGTNQQNSISHFYEHAHNDLLEALYEFGYIGFAVLLCLIVSVVVVFIRSAKTSGVIITFSSILSQSIASLSVYVFHAPVSLFMFCLTLGLFYSEVTNAKPSKIE